MPLRNIVTFNALIAAYSRSRQHATSVFKVLSEMEIQFLRPNGSTFTSQIQASSLLEDWLMGSALHTQVIKFGFLDDICVQTSLLGMYSNCGDLESAKQVFSRIVDKDAMALNSMILGYMKNDDIPGGLQFFGSMVRAGATPTPFTFSMVLNACNKLGDHTFGQLIHAQVIVSGTPTDLPLQNALLDMYCSCGDTHTAFCVFSRIENPDLVSWNSMIAGYSENGDGEEAMSMFVQLCRMPFAKPDEYTFAAIISATGAFPASAYGKPLHALVKKAGFERSVYVGSTLVSMYFNNGEPDSAQNIFNSIPEKDVVLWTEMITDMYAKIGDLQAAELILSQVTSPDLKCWNSMLGGYGHHGKAEEAFKVFDEILIHNLNPDQVTFISLLAACSHCGLVDKGKFLWIYMKESGLVPGPKHYSCMVSLLSRAGLLEEAEEMIIESPFSQDYLDLWRTLLSYCVAFRNLRIGVRAAEQVLSIDAEDSATHTLLTNLYAAAGRWDGVTKMRRKIRGLMLEKDPGLSWIEVMNNIHVFSSGDQSHLDVDEMQAGLCRLQGNMIRSEIDEI
ncbi:hypothetical protein F0562_003885 [Nyssa sinensis]|uniref:Pentatricopeptide repeat-containing protein n=1 Tax=Nyssa sinensis TaxID=561372 RepID=A0A5J5C1E3_9ASTE|nr:hypothetical protein F0562_003885 [Nyssa sinensis]